ncbi:MAG: hypothetical protein WCI21_08925 [Alphaproteobacteria bacterium]
MSTERKQILQMLGDGQINAEEAERLLAALERTSEAPSFAAPRAPGEKPKYLRVVVDAEDHKRGGPVKVNIRVPMQLLRAGVRLSALIPPHAREQANAAMHEHGVPFDLNQLKPENLDELIEHLDELTVDVDQEEAKVRIFCE